MKKTTILLGALLFVARAWGDDAVAADKPATPAPAAIAPKDTEETTRDTLVYKDGDRIHGKVISKNADTIVFQSERFGELRVPASGAVVILAEKAAEPAAQLPAMTVAAQKPATPAKKVEPKTAPRTPAQVAAAAVETEKRAVATAVEKAEVEKVSLWDRFSPAQLTAKMRNFFGPWRGKISVSTEIVRDTTERGSASGEIQLRRKWKYDEVSLTARYDYSQTTDIATTDMVKANGLWRHEFKTRAFAQYRPTLEWNRAAFKSALPADYLLLQQEIGVGLRLIVKPTRTVRVGVSENIFDTWGLADNNRSHTSRTIESAFVEAELKLPWRMTLTDRSVYYYSISGSDTGWENNFELSKRFTETLSTALRHEVRRGSPDSRVQDYTRLKLMIGLDF